LAKGVKTKTQPDEIGPEKAPGGFNVEPSYDDPYPSCYSNYASVSHTLTEICIDFCTIAAPYRVDMNNGVLRVPVVAQVLLQSEVARGLINALQEQLTKQAQERERGTIIIPVKEEPSVK